MFLMSKDNAMHLFVLFAAAFGLLGVIAGAFGTHGLESQLDPDQLDAWKTGARYQMYHALALFGTAWIAGQLDATAPVFAGWMFVAGIVVFSGSLYLLAVTGIDSLGAITPFGGLALMLGWGALFVAGLQLPAQTPPAP